MVDKGLFDDYSLALRTIARLAHDDAESLVADTDPTDDPMVSAAKLLDRYPQLVRDYGMMAASAAREYYQQSRDMATEQGDADGEYEAIAAPPVQREWAEEDVQQASRDGLGTLSGIAVRRTLQRADQTLSMNMRRDPSKPMWAIVPHPGACGWCILVASNGWRYSSEERANAQRHDNCKCSVAVDWSEDPALEGYDPDALYERYQQGIEDAGNVQAMWDALTPEEQAKYQRTGRGAFDVFKWKQVAKNIH